MGAFQLIAVGLCVLLNALDGFDVLSISFAAPGIARQWGIDRGALGVVLSIELIGMSLGSISMGQLADRLGRRPVILMCLVIMGSGMLLASQALGVGALSAFRLLTGVGIGGMLATTNAMVAEYANDRYRHTCVTLMAAGFPIGAIVGGAVSSLLLTTFDWRAVFILGGAATVLAFPLVWFLLPESIAYLVRAQPRDALERVNATLRRMRHVPVDELRRQAAPAVGAARRGLFSTGLARSTVLLTAAYFAHIMTFYYVMKWTPKIVADMGHPPALAGGVLVWLNVGGATSAILFGVLARRVSLRGLAVATLVLSAAAVCVFGTGFHTIAELSASAALAGFCANAGVYGLYAMMASTLPTEVRAGGTGFIIGVGRGGAALGPVFAGLLFASGSGLLAVSALMAIGSVLAGAALLALPALK
jgi:benzoate transport